MSAGDTFGQAGLARGSVLGEVTVWAVQSMEEGTAGWNSWLGLLTWMSTLGALSPP